MERGVFYIALGAPYLAEARRSAASAKAANPGLLTAVLTDQVIEPDADFDQVILREMRPSSVATIGKDGERYLALDRAAYYQKIAPLSQSPFEKTIFLDTDTWVAGSLEPVFDLLDRFDLLVTPAFVTHDYAFERTESPFSAIPEAFGYFNSGFFAYRRNPSTSRFLQTWQHLFETEVAHLTVNDQPALRLALFREREATFHVIPTCYNTITWSPFVIPGGGRAVVLHGRNPWLQKWAHHFQSGTPVIIGSLRPTLLFRYHLSRLLYLIQRRLKKTR